jgi:hypothetical protein
MKLIEVLERNANNSMDIQLTNGQKVTATSWSVGDEVLEAHKQQGYSIYICLDKIVSVQASS